MYCWFKVLTLKTVRWHFSKNVCWTWQPKETTKPTMQENWTSYQDLAEKFTVISNFTSSQTLGLTWITCLSVQNQWVRKGERGRKETPDISCFKNGRVLGKQFKTDYENSFALHFILRVHCYKSIVQISKPTGSFKLINYWVPWMFKIRNSATHYYHQNIHQTEKNIWKKWPTCCVVIFIPSLVDVFLDLQEEQVPENCKENEKNIIRLVSNYVARNLWLVRLAPSTFCSKFWNQSSGVIHLCCNSVMNLPYPDQL